MYCMSFILQGAVEVIKCIQYIIVTITMGKRVVMIHRGQVDDSVTLEAHNADMLTLEGEAEIHI